MRSFLILIVLLSVAMVAPAAPSTNPLFSDHMVLQKGTSVPVWGKADRGEAIRVSLMDGSTVVSEASTEADDKGAWRVNLDTSKAPQTPLELIIAGTTTLKASDVLVGQVWLCSGQSNMAWSVQGAKDAEREARQANYPQIRHFEVPHTSQLLPSEELKGQWVVTSSQSVGTFSAVAYYFGRALHLELKAPIGLINSSVGGTAAESWATDESLKGFDEFNIQRAQARDALLGMDNAVAKYRVDLKEWEAKLPLHADPKLAESYSSIDLDTKDWDTVTLPRQIEATDPDFDGSIWYRTELTLDAVDAAASISFGRVDDHDVTYINGKRVGGIGNDNDGAWATPRRYDIPAGVLKPGRNMIAVRVFDTWLAGGFMGAPADMWLQVGTKRHSLAGEWKSKIEHRLDPDQKAIAAQRPGNPQNAVNVPSMLYNGMIHPLKPYAIAGAIWYQGEANVNRDKQYRSLLPAMIQGWRTAWDQKCEPVIAGEAGRDFPFYIVQLANFMEYRRDPNFNTQWAPIRDVQAHVASTLANCGLAVTIDIGDERDIHPGNKQDVGKRLAAVALAKAYGKKVPFAGPTFSKLDIQGNRAIVTFDHVEQGLAARPLAVPEAGDRPNVYRELVTHPSPVKGFAIRGEDGKWFWAKAQINDQRTIEVWSDDVAKPVAVRYGWADNPVVNLYNSADFPAVPFQTQP